MPCAETHRRISDPYRDGNRALGLFCNSLAQGLHVYGEQLYRFSVDPGRLLEIPDDMRQPGYCAAYYRGVRDLIDHLGYAGVKVTHDDGIISGRDHGFHRNPGLGLCRGCGLIS